MADVVDGMGDGSPVSDSARLVQMLKEVVTHGAPAQQARARELLVPLERGDADEALIEAASLLVDAFGHDPYLWR